MTSNIALISDRHKIKYNFLVFKPIVYSEIGFKFLEHFGTGKVFSV